MIRYNYPYRGAYEYDKFVLNYLQLHNEAIFINSRALKNLKEEQAAVREQYDTTTGEEAVYGTFARHLAARL